MADYEKILECASALAYALKEYSREGKITDSERQGLIALLNQEAAEVHQLDASHESELLAVSSSISRATPEQAKKVCIQYLPRFIEQTDRLTVEFRQSRKISALAEFF